MSYMIKFARPLVAAAARARVPSNASAARMMSTKPALQAVPRGAAPVTVPPTPSADHNLSTRRAGRQSYDDKHINGTPTEAHERREGHSPTINTHGASLAQSTTWPSLVDKHNNILMPVAEIVTTKRVGKAVKLHETRGRGYMVIKPTESVFHHQDELSASIGSYRNRNGHQVSIELAPPEPDPEQKKHKMRMKTATKKPAL